MLEGYVGDDRVCMGGDSVVAAKHPRSEYPLYRPLLRHVLHLVAHGVSDVANRISNVATRCPSGCFHLLVAPSTVSPVLVCFAMLLLNFDELVYMPRTWSLLLCSTWRLLIIGVIASHASHPVAYVAALVLVSGVVYQSLHLRRRLMCRVVSSALIASVLYEYGLPHAIAGALLAWILPTCMELRSML